MSERPTDKWSRPGHGAQYVRERWGTKRRASRDPRLVAELVDRYAPDQAERRVLDVPCGTGRLREAVAPRAGAWFGCDLSAAMLDEASRRAPGRLVRGDLARLPFPDGTFDVVVACRILHHLHGVDALREVVTELVRVSRGLVVASFWDSASLPAWRRRRGLAKSEGPTGRTDHPKARIAELFEGAGAPVVGWRHNLRFLSQQTFAVARRSGG